MVVMEATEIRFRYKRDRKIYTIRPNRLYEDGHIEFTMFESVPGYSEPMQKTVIAWPKDYEVIPEEDFYEFRRQTARMILLHLLEKGNDENYSIEKAIKITDKFIKCL